MGSRLGQLADSMELLSHQLADSSCRPEEPVLDSPCREGKSQPEMVRAQQTEGIQSRRGLERGLRNKRRQCKALIYDTLAFFIRILSAWAAKSLKVKTNGT
jgi:hypothetical protein